MKKYFVKGTDKEVKEGDTFKLEFEFDETTAQFLEALDVVDVQDFAEDGDDDEDEEYDPVEEAVGHLLEWAQDTELRLDKLEGKVERLLKAVFPKNKKHCTNNK